MREKINFKKPEWSAILAAFFAGLAVHMFGLTNLLHNGDDITAQPVGFGVGVESGRFFLHILKKLCQRMSGGYNVSWLNGILFIVLIAIAAGIVISIFNMDQAKIGKFIAGCRKKVNLTQMQLAEKLNITDRAVSKWETGKAMPDSSVMLALCDVLKITVNDLLSGEVVTMDNYNKELENNLLEMVRQKQEADRRLLRAEMLAGVMASIPFAVGIVIGLAVPMEEWKQVVIVLSSMIPLLVAIPFLLRIEQVAGYYECQHCRHQYVPRYISVFAAPHIGRTRYMKCPECGKGSWQRKVISKE